MNKESKSIIAIIAAVILVAAVGFFVYKNYYLKVSENKNKNSAIQNILPELTKPETPITKPVTETSGLIAGYRLYKNSSFGFEIQYPNTWSVSEENIENVRSENTKAFYFKKSGSDLRFAILPRDGLSYGLPENGASNEVLIGGFPGTQRKWTLSDGRRLWLLNPQYGWYNWSEDIGRIDILSSVTDSAGDTAIFEKMLNSFKLSK